MVNMKYLDDSLKRRLIFVIGKGGVGKSTLAWALAEALDRVDRRVGLVSFSPFMSAREGRIAFHSLETLGCFREYALRVLRFDRVFDAIFENPLLKAFVRAAPGLSSTVLAGKVWDLVERREQDTLIVDMPSSGHSVAFFRSLLAVAQLFPTGFVREQTRRILDLFLSNDARFDLVCLATELAVTETCELYAELSNLARFSFGFTLVNRCLPNTRPVPHLHEEGSGGQAFAKRCLIMFERQESLIRDLGTIPLPLLRVGYAFQTDPALELSKRIVDPQS